MNKFIIASHSTFAEGVYNCLKFFKYDIDNVFYINAYVEHNEFEKDFVELIEQYQNENLIVLTDMPGGSVNKVCFQHMNTYNFHLISGINFPLALEMIFVNEELDHQLIKELIENAKTQIVYLNEVEIEANEEDEL